MISPQRLLLRALLGSIAVSAALGIWAVLGDFGRIEEKVLLTALAMSGTSLLAMASLSSWSLASGRHWMSRVEVAQQGGAEVTFCPRCGKRLWQPALRGPLLHRAASGRRAPDRDRPSLGRSGVEPA